MRITRLSVHGYRSIRALQLPLGQVNVITGPNGAGKSNLYRSLLLLGAAARGELARALAQEGGLPSALWAGPRRHGRRKPPPVRLRLGLELQAFRYELQLGLPVPRQVTYPWGGELVRAGTLFARDPEVKQETLDVPVRGRARPVRLLERKDQSAWLQDEEGRRVSYPLELVRSESVVSQLSDPRRFPELAALREVFGGWRVHHHLRTDPDAPVRRPQPGARTPVLSADGSDLLCALHTIREDGDARALEEAVRRALPQVERFEVVADDQGRLSLELRVRGVPRPFGLEELSEGTLRYLALCAALLSPRPPALLCLNEPEASLHPDLLAPLAGLLLRASRSAQLWVTTHSPALAAALAAGSGEPPLRLRLRAGATELAGEEEE